MTHDQKQQNQTHRDQTQDEGTVALRILHDMLRGGSTTAQLTSQYGISAFTLKRYLCELRHLGVEFTHYEVDGQRLWRCRNQELVQSSALFHMWRSHEAGRLGEGSRAA